MLGKKMREKCEARGIAVLAPARQEADLSSPVSLEDFFQKNDFQVLLNCAGFSKVDSCEDPAQYPEALAVNASGPGWLAKLCKTSGRRLIHFSTDYVFNGEKDGTYAEEEPPRPINAYGRTKWMGEKMILAQVPSYYLIRTSWLFGPGGRNFVKTMAGILKNLPSAEVVADQKGAPTYTGDLADFTLDLMEKKAPDGIYHFSNAGETSWFGIAVEIQKCLNLNGRELVPVPTDKFPRPAQRPRNSRFDLGKAAGALARDIRPWPEAVREYLLKELPLEPA